MAEYIVEFDKEPYDQMVADGILKETDNPTLYGMPIRGEIIRCRDCKHFRDVPMADGSKGHRCSGVFTFVEPTPDGFCAWAERDE